MQKIAILTGGTSSERDIALTSAQTVAKLLGERFNIKQFIFPEEINAFLVDRGLFDCVIPVFHGRGGEDGTVQGFLKTLGIPFLFSDVTAHAIGMDKALAKTVVTAAGLNTVPWVVLRDDQHVDVGSLDFPCVVKPLDGGSTQGVTIVHAYDEFLGALKQAFAYAERVLIEHFIDGDEFTVAVIDEGSEVIALPVIQIVSPGGFYDYAAKYGSQPAEKLCPAPIADVLASRLQQAAVTAHRVIGARHMSRTDFIVDHEGTIWFLEINTIPGQSVLFPKAVKASGRDFAGVFERWISGV